MNCKDIHKYTEQKYIKHSKKKIQEFVRKKNLSKDEFLFGIYFKNDSSSKYMHVGNIKLGPLNKFHKTADVSYFIGEKNFWGKGIATSAIKQIIKIAKKKGIKKVKAGVYEMNTASKKVLLKCGFRLEGNLKFELVYSGKRFSHYLFGKLI